MKESSYFNVKPTPLSVWDNPSWVNETSPRTRAQDYVEIVNSPSQVLRYLQFCFDKGFVDDDLGRDIGDFTFLPGFHLLPHRVEVALHPVHTHRDAVDERKRFRVFGQHRRKSVENNSPAVRGLGWPGSIQCRPSACVYYGSRLLGRSGIGSR